MISLMGLGEITKQFAKEALLDTLRPADPPRVSEGSATEKVAGEGAGATILRQVQAMQTALKENEELLVLFHNGFETLRVLDFFVPSAQVIVLAGIDTDKNITRVIAPAESLQLTCKVMKVQPPAKPARIRFITPK
jgi:hypothetical protein